MNGMRGVRLSGRQVWTRCATTAAAAANDTTFLEYWNTTTQSRYVVSFDPDDSKTMPPPMTSLAQVFSRYVLRRAVVHYVPMTGTDHASGNGFGLAVLTDVALARAQDTVSAATFNTAMSVTQNSNSVMSPMWQTCSLEVPCDNEVRFTYQSVADGSLSVAEDRQEHPFAVIGALQVPTTTSTLWGYLHLEYVIDFYEIATGALETSRLQRRLATLSPQVTAEREEKKMPSSTSPEGSLQESLSGGWVRAPSLREWSEPRVTLTREGQAAGLVKSQSQKA